MYQAKLRELYPDLTNASFQQETYAFRIKDWASKDKITLEMMTSVMGRVDDQQLLELACVLGNLYDWSWLLFTKLTNKPARQTPSQKAEFWRLKDCARVCKEKKNRLCDLISPEDWIDAKDVPADQIKWFGIDGAEYHSKFQ